MHKERTLQTEQTGGARPNDATFASHYLYIDGEINK